MKTKLSNLIADGKAKPFIIVMENGRGMGGLRDYSEQPRQVLAYFHRRQHRPDEYHRHGGFKEKVKVVFVSYENGAAGKANVEALNQAGINSVFYELPNTGHEWQTWRRSLYEFAPLLFKN